MNKLNKKLISLSVAVMYCLCILVSSPALAYGVTSNGHQTAAYTKAQKTKAAKAALTALAKLPADAYVTALIETPRLKVLIDNANRQLAAATKMKLNVTGYKNYERLSAAIQSYTSRLAAEKAATEKLATDAVMAKAVSDLITALPTTVTKADEVKVVMARSAYSSLTAEQMKLVLNVNVLAAAEAKVVEVNKITVVAVTADSAKTIKVLFSTAPANYNKVTFSVLRIGLPVALTTTWNEAKTEATLTATYNLMDGEYLVSVKNDLTDLGISKVSFFPQKIAKINFVSTTLAVVGLFPANQKGYATYQILDQYGVDVSNTYLANNVMFQCGYTSSPIVKSNGALVITPNADLFTKTNIMITAVDPTTGVSLIGTLNPSMIHGTLSDIYLYGLTNAENKVLTAGDTTSVFYVTYRAVDFNGSETKDYNLVKNGLILNGVNKITSSSPMVQAEIVPDPLDSSKAAIKVTVVDPTAIGVDTPISITAITYSGRTAALVLTLKKGL